MGEQPTKADAKGCGLLLLVTLVLAVGGGLIAWGCDSVFGGDDPLADLPPIDQTEDVNRETFAGTWPLTVDSGELQCDWLRGGGEAASFIAPDGRRYGLNGSARSRLDLPKIDPIWADNPDIAGTKLNARDLLNAALELC